MLLITYVSRRDTQKIQLRAGLLFSVQSWTKGWRQIDKIKQNRFFYGMFYSWFFAIFTKKRKNLALGWTAGYSPSNLSISGIFLKFPNFLRSKSYFVRQLVRQLLHLLSGDNNVVPFYLWWREILQKSEKVSKYFVQDCSWLAKGWRNAESLKLYFKSEPRGLVRWYFRFPFVLKSGKQKQKHQNNLSKYCSLMV